MLKELWQGLLDLIYPSNIYCICCGRPINDRLPYALCGYCVRTLKWANKETCDKCGKPLEVKTDDSLCSDCINEPRAFEKGFTCVGYGRSEREIIHRFKYNDKAYYGEKLAWLMYERICEENLGEDLIVPVPMYKEKEKRRGYNQAALLAKHLAYRLGKPYEPDLLTRKSDTIPMSGLGAEERRGNIKGVFEVSKGKEHMLYGSTVLLVDDVFTTGSTADGCTDAMLKAGADKVYVITFAAGTDTNRRSISAG